MKTKSILRILIATALILLIPLIAMQFSDDVDWKLGDFVIIGMLLTVSGLIFELISKKVNSKYRPIVAVVVVAGVLLIWAELAVGIFGTPIAGS